MTTDSLVQRLRENAKQWIPANAPEAVLCREAAYKIEAQQRAIAREKRKVAKLRREYAHYVECRK